MVFYSAIKWSCCLICLISLALRMPPPVFARSTPSSPRSRQVILRRQAALQSLLADRGFYWGAPIYVRLFKAEKILEIWLRDGHRFRRFRQYPVCTYGGKGLGPKTAQGDGRAPEGFYFVGPRQMNPNSRYHLAFNVGYPNAYDRSHHRTGGHLMIHGRCVSIGCFAMTNALMEEIYVLADAALRHGQPFFRVHIFPFVMTERNMLRYANKRWNSFWLNLKQGYDWFARNNDNPPDVAVTDGLYRFRDSMSYTE